MLILHLNPPLVVEKSSWPSFITFFCYCLHASLIFPLLLCYSVHSHSTSFVSHLSPQWGHMAADIILPSSFLVSQPPVRYLRPKVCDGPEAIQQASIAVWGFVLGGSYLGGIHTRVNQISVQHSDCYSTHDHHPLRKILVVDVAQYAKICGCSLSTVLLFTKIENSCMSPERTSRTMPYSSCGRCDIIPGWEC